MWELPKYYQSKKGDKYLSLIVAWEFLNLLCMKKFLKALYIIQEVSNKDRNPKLGDGYNTASRLNPYNPLSYLTVIVMTIVWILMYGVVGFWKEVDKVNPFKWN